MSLDERDDLGGALRLGELCEEAEGARHEVEPEEHDRDPLEQLAVRVGDDDVVLEAREDARARGGG